MTVEPWDLRTCRPSKNITIIVSSLTFLTQLLPRFYMILTCYYRRYCWYRKFKPENRIRYRFPLYSPIRPQPRTPAPARAGPEIPVERTFSPRDARLTHIPRQPPLPITRGNTDTLCCQFLAPDTDGLAEQEARPRPADPGPQPRPAPAHKPACSWPPSYRDRTWPPRDHYRGRTRSHTAGPGG